MKFKTPGRWQPENWCALMFLYSPGGETGRSTPQSQVPDNGVYCLVSSTGLIANCNESINNFFSGTSPYEQTETDGDRVEIYII